MLAVKVPYLTEDKTYQGWRDQESEAEKQGHASYGLDHSQPACSRSPAAGMSFDSDDNREENQPQDIVNYR